MESLVADGLFSGVLDITTTELADELVGGVLSAGPRRLTAASEAGVPQVVSVGATDMVNFHAADTVPEEFQGREFHEHNATVTLMRTTAAENARLGQEIGAKVAAARGPPPSCCRCGECRPSTRRDSHSTTPKRGRPCSTPFAPAPTALSCSSWIATSTTPNSPNAPLTNCLN